MKVPLLLTGLRKVEEGYNHYWKHIVENYDTDVYLQFWEDEDYEKVLKIYNPKNIYNINHLNLQNIEKVSNLILLKLTRIR